MQRSNLNHEQIQKEWDRMNQLFEQTDFVSESEVRQLALSHTPTQFRQRLLACRRNTLLSVFNSTMLSAGLFSTGNAHPPTLLRVITILWIVSLLALAFSASRLLLFTILKSPRLRLSDADRASRLLDHTERITLSRASYSTDTRPRSTMLFSPQTASAAICLAAMVVCLVWNQPHVQTDTPAVVVAKADYHPVAASVTDNPAPEQPHQPHTVHPVRAASTAAPSTPASPTAQPGIQVVCNSEFCSAEKYCAILYEDLLSI